VGGPHDARLTRRRRELEGPEGVAQEPRLERAVEDGDLVVARDERGAQRPVDVVAKRQVDVVEPAQRIGDPARADLEPALP
jgi:hypothetical protein